MIMPLEINRVYKIIGGTSYAIIKYMGKTHMVYQRYHSMEFLMSGQFSENATLIEEFRKNFIPTDFIFDSGEV
jgi:hypothetical protein